MAESLRFFFLVQILLCLCVSSASVNAQAQLLNITAWVNKTVMLIAAHPDVIFNN
jgi:hypothetical protein